MTTHSPTATSQQLPAFSVPLVAHHLRFTVRATETIAFNAFKGSALRGALAGTMRRHFCPEWRAGETDPLHRSLCPVCQLLSLENDESIPGDVRRPYAIRPPLDERMVYEAGETFAFDLILYGDSLHYLPYLALTVQGMGEQSGVGRRNEEGRRGRFTVERIDAVNPLTAETQSIYNAEQRMVRQPAIPVTHVQVTDAATRLAADLDANEQKLTVHFRTPTRLIRRRAVVRSPDFFAFAKQCALRLLDMSAQHGGGRPTIDGEPVQVRRAIYQHAEPVTLVHDETRWWDLAGYSGRLGRAQRLGGLVGRATFHAPDWRPLLPWLIWGTVLGVGKNVVKGCGVVGVGC